MKTRLLRYFGCAAALALLFSPLVGHAAPIQIKGYNTATFKMPGSNATHQGGSQPWDINSVNPGGSKFTWGEASTSRNYLEFKPLNATSGNQFNTFTDTPIKLGTLDYFNGITVSGSNVDHVDLIVSLTLTIPNVGLTAYDFKFQMLSRVNPDPDDVTFATAFADTSFNVGGVDYTLKLLGFSATGGEPFREAFLSQGEGKKASTGLWAMVTAVPPPRPVGGPRTRFNHLGGHRRPDRLGLRGSPPPEGGPRVIHPPQAIPVS